MAAKEAVLSVPCPHCDEQTALKAEVEKRKVTTLEGMIDEVIYRKQEGTCGSCGRSFRVCNFRGSFSLLALKETQSEKHNP